MLYVIEGRDAPPGAGSHIEPALLLIPPDARVRTLSPIATIAAPLARGTAVHRSALPLGIRSSIRPGSPIHVFGRNAARWALNATRDAELCATMLESPCRVTPRTRRWAERLVRFDRIDVLDETDAKAWHDAGVPQVLLHVTEPHAEEAASNVARLGQSTGLPTDRASLRSLLAAEEDEQIIFPLASPWSTLDAQRFVFVLGLLRVAGHRVSGIVPASAWRLAGARMFRRRSRLGTRLIVIDGPMTPWLSACDAAFLDAARPRERLFEYRPVGALRVLMAAARSAGVPIAMAPGNVLETTPRRAHSVADEVRPLLDTLQGRADSLDALVGAMINT